jgi:hypothetical protein
MKSVVIKNIGTLFTGDITVHIHDRWAIFH